MWLAVCRAYPNASLAIRLLKQIGGKHPDLILQGMGGGVEAASAFQAELRRSAPEGTLAGAEQVTLSPLHSWLGVHKLSQEMECMLITSLKTAQFTIADQLLQV